MATQHTFRISSNQKPGLLARIVLTVATLGLVIVGFFFLTVALVAGALLALVIGARLWWSIRKLKRAAAAGETMGGEHYRGGKDALDGEYQVVERESGEQKLPPKT